MITQKVSGASGATLKTQKWLNFRTLFCAASYNIRKGFPSFTRGTFRDFLTPPLTTLRVDGKKAQISPECPGTPSAPKSPQDFPFLSIPSEARVRGAPAPHLLPSPSFPSNEQCISMLQGFLEMAKMQKR